MLSFADVLQKLEPVARETAVWAESHLEIGYYVTDCRPPVTAVSSVRGIVFQADAVLAIADGYQWHIVPGGRCEPDETIEETLRRELLEETGWTIQNPRYLGFTHFHHLTPKPEPYPYPYPDFYQMIFTAQADAYCPEKMVPDPYVQDVQFFPFSAVSQLSLDNSQRALLAAAQAAAHNAAQNATQNAR